MSQLEKLSGIVEGMSNEDYHKRPELSSSQIKTLLKNPYEYAHNIKKEQTEAMKIGSALHCLVLEPHKFGYEFAVEPEVDGRTAAGKAARADFALSAQGKTILTAKMGATARGAASAVLKSRAASLLQGGMAEVSVFGFVTNSEGKKYPARCRVDYSPIEQLIADLKQSADASPDGFTRAAATYEYYIQAAWYMDVCQSVGLDVRRFVFVAVEPVDPHMVGVYDLDPAWLEFGRSEYRRALDIYDRIDDFKEPFYRDTKTGDFVQTLSAPAWLFYKRNASY